jgi:hypothetical protein
LNQTFGETLKEAWVESESHKRLKEFLLRRIMSKAITVASVLTAGPEEVGAPVDLEAAVVAGEDKQQINVVVLPSHARTAPAGAETSGAAAA